MARPLAPTMANRLNLKIVAAVVAVVVLLALWLPSSTIPSQSREYISHIVSAAKGRPQVNPQAEAAWEAAKQEEAAAKEGLSHLEPVHAAVPEITTPPTHAAVAIDAEITPTSTSTYNSWDPTKNPNAPTDEPGFNFDKWFFQADIGEYPAPEIDIAHLKTLAPRHYKGPGHPTFATYYASRAATMQDPYFLAAQQIVYRMLWDPRSRSRKYPMTVFVAPFVSQEQRDWFLAAGAFVRELPLIPFTPNEKTTHKVAGRLVDMFSKLEMWNQTDFTRIAYMDSDAFPIANIDEIFDLAPEQRCREEMLAPADQHSPSGLCNYVFTGHNEFETVINAGVLVFKPNEGLCDLLKRESQNDDNYDNGLAEQAFMNYFYRPSGPFPWSTIAESWNGSPKVVDDGHELFILHAKIWALYFPPEHWASHVFNDTWVNMKSFYEGPDFATYRAEDNKKGYHGS